MPLQETSGTASYDAFGGGAPVAPVYIEDVYSTFLYTGNGSTQTITNGIDLSGQGGMTWIKSRSSASNNFLFDTTRGVNRPLISNGTQAQATYNPSLYAFNSSGFSVDASVIAVNTNAINYASWTFRKQPKFFDVVTYTGDGSNPRALSHNLGSVPGAIIVKRTDSTSNWGAWIQKDSTTVASYLSVNSTAASSGNDTLANCATSTTFQVNKLRDDSGGGFNLSGATYVAYLFAHNAGGFGLTGTDNVISCGSVTADGTGAFSVNLGYEPQFVISKMVSGSDSWYITDVMRGMSQTSVNPLQANSSAAETTPTGNLFYPTATGFGVTSGWNGTAGATYIYIAIRRGPMKTPTSGTSVFKPSAYTGNGGTTTINAGFSIDLSMTRVRAVATGQTLVADRLRGASQRLFTDSTTSESTSSTAVTSLASNTSITFGANGDTNSSGQTYVTWDFRRAPGFFDEVCYTGTGANTTVTHNLGVAPELMIVKYRNASATWIVYSAPTGNTQYLALNQNWNALSNANHWNNTTPTASVFSLSSNGNVNASGGNYVAYLFASCPGVSKVGSYTGTGATQTISCGFAARFVLIKRTDSTGDWFVWDTARGMVAGTDPRLALNSTAAETNANWVYTDASGFQIVTTDATVNASGGSYIFLAVS